MERYVYEETFMAKYFSPNGRLDRLPYVLRTSLLFMIYGVIMQILQLFIGNSVATMMYGGRGGGILVLAGLIMLVLTIIFVVIFMFLAVRRFHDLNKSGFLAWLFVLPILWLILIYAVSYIFGLLLLINIIANIVLYFYLIFKQGSYGTNNFGPDPLFETSLRYCETPETIPREF